MLVVMQSHATEQQVRAVCERIESLGLKAHPIPGALRTANALPAALTILLATTLVATTLIALFGERRVHWAIMVVAFVVGIPVFFQISKLSSSSL